MSKYKLIDILVMISKGELKEGTKIKWDIYEYIYKDDELVRKECGVSYYIFEDMESRHLNTEVELIESECKHEWEKYSLGRLGGITENHRYCAKCGIDEIEPNHFTDVGKMATERIQELDIDSTTWNDLYIEQRLDILFEKQNEVIRRINNERL